MIALNFEFYHFEISLVQAFKVKFKVCCYFLTILKLKSVSLTTLSGLYKSLTVTDIEQFNLGLEDCRHAAHRVFPPDSPDLMG